MTKDMKVWKRSGIILFLVLLTLAMLVVPAGAQTARGTISGRVLDANQAVVPGATIKITHIAQGTVTTVVTNDAGAFTAPYLPPGLYNLTTEVSGFKKYVRDQLQLQVNQNLVLDVVLEVGGQEQVITVTAEQPLLNTSSNTLGQVVDERRIADLPLPHGNPYLLIGVTPGASWSHTAGTLNRPFEPTHIVGYSINGSRANRMDVTIDGTPSTATANANEVIATYVPPTDAIQEFKVQTTGFDASYGQTEGGVTNIVLKSGSNRLHGTGYWANQPASMAANEWLSNKSRSPRADWKYNRWGGSLGGPVFIPKVYNGKNKTFFFWAYEGIHEARPRNNCGSNCTVPTEAEKNGDFSNLLAKGGSSYQIFNPFTRALVNGVYVNQPFTGNIIPTNLINPIAKKILDNYYPKTPYTSGDALGLGNQVEPNIPETIRYYTHTFKVDHNINDRQRLSVTGRFYKRISDYNNYLHSAATGEWFQFLSRAGSIDYVNALSNSMVLNLKYGYNRFIRSSDGNPESYGLDLTTLGFPSYMNDYTPESIRRFPGIFFATSGTTSAAYIGTRHDNFIRPIDTHTFTGNLTKMKGTHSIRTGLEFRAYRENQNDWINDQTGRFDFSTEWTKANSNATGAPNGLGQSMAAFLLGLPSATSYINRQDNYAEQSTSWGVFVQDDWRVNNRLTLNLGLRWEYEGALTERYDRSVRGFDPTYTQPIEAAAVAAYTKVYNAAAGTANALPIAPADFKVRGGLNYAGVNGNPRGLYETPKKNFLPQIGLAFKLTDKTVLRAGYGINYGFLGQRRGDVIQSGYNVNTNMVPTLDNGLTWNETLSNPYKNGPIMPYGNSQGPQTFLGQAITYFIDKPMQPYNQRWSLNLQHESKGWLLDVGYVGNRGTHIEIARNLNATPNYYLSTSPTRDQSKIAYLNGTVANPFYGLLPTTTTIGGSKTISRERLMRAFPEFDTVNATTNQGYSWYHSFQFSIQKRFSKGYTLLGSYTWSKFMQATEYLSGGDSVPTETISDMDTPHRISMTGIMELPFGSGKRFKSSSPVVDRIIGGWQVNANYQIQSARPMGMANFGNIIYYGDYKDLNLGSAATPDKWFNNVIYNPKKADGTLVWPTLPESNVGFEKRSTNDANGQLDKNVRTFPLRFSFLRSDLVNNVDFSILKNTKIKEGMNIQYRCELLNAFNHPNFSAPDLGPTSSNFGKITGGAFNYSRRIQMDIKFIF
jgi:hypothetical protein